MTLNLEASVHISHCEKAFSKKNIITKHPRAQTWENHTIVVIVAKVLKVTFFEK